MVQNYSAKKVFTFGTNQVGDIIIDSAFVKVKLNDFEILAILIRSLAESSGMKLC